MDSRAPAPHSPPMGQRRPKPPEKRSNYITREGFERLRVEFDRLWHEERPRVVQGVADAAAEGDRSENAEYIYGKKKLREIDRKLRHLGQRIEAVTVVEPDADRDDGKVFFGAWVRLESLDEDDDTGEIVLRIVGPDEFDPDRGWISMDSPMAKALLRREEGDEVLVRRPRGETLYEILEVSYRPLS